MTADPHADDKVLLWRVGLGVGERDAIALRRHLSPAELDRFERLRGSEVGRRWLVSRGALREILAAELGVPPSAVALRLGEHGRPRLGPDGPETDLDFNLSHSGDLALVAVARGTRVGVDVERLRPGRNPLRVAGRFFSPAEVEAVAAVPPDERPRAFLRYWTAKEALAKGLGMGLKAPRGELELEAAPDGSLAPLRAPGWRLVEIDQLPEGYCGTLATEREPAAIAVRNWLPDDAPGSR